VETVDGDNDGDLTAWSVGTKFELQVEILYQPCRTQSYGTSAIDEGSSLLKRVPPQVVYRRADTTVS